MADAYAGLVRFGAFLVGERAGGEDVAQAALMKVYRAWPRIEDKAAAGAYTRKVTDSACSVPEGNSHE